MSKIAKVPVVMQMEALECGAAALCMILAYYGKWISLEQVRADCGVSRDGSDARNIIRAAKAYGLKASGYRMEPSALREIAFPAIIHWNFNHFVVLDGFKKNKAVINDPGKGRVEVPLDEFDRSFTGIVLRFEKGEGFQKEGKPKSVWAFAFKRLKHAVPSMIFIMLISALMTMTGFLMPAFSKLFMDEILSGKNKEWLGPFIWIVLAGIAFTFVVKAVESLNWMRIFGRFAITANAEYVWHTLHLPMTFFSQRWVGDITSRLNSNARIASTLLQRAAPTVINLVLLALYLWIMLRYSVLLTLIGVLTIVLNVVVTRITSQKIADLSRSVQAGTGKLAGFTLSGIGMIETIKAAGAENGFFERWSGYHAKVHNAQVSIYRATHVYDALAPLLQQITNTVVLMTGVFLILDGTFTIGTLLAFQGLLYAFFTPVNQLLELTKSIITMRVDMERVDDVLNYPRDDQVSLQKDLLNAEPVGKLSGHLEIRSLTFGYSPIAEPFLKDFSMSVPAGSSVAIIGASGCGKSTVAKLIAGLYRPWSGEILFDGKPREEIDTYSFRSSVAIVDQEITLFEDTIANNIRLWDRSIEDFAVILAARDAGIHDTIVTRSQGYRSIIKEGGKNFSGGERQRLEIARVLALEPSIIILDEATSALDAQTESMVMQSIRNTGATCITIAHRLSTIRDCREIIVLDRGVVVERGTHDQLIGQNGRYTSLIATE